MCRVHLDKRSGARPHPHCPEESVAEHNYDLHRTPSLGPSLLDVARIWFPWDRYLCRRRRHGVDVDEHPLDCCTNMAVTGISANTHTNAPPPPTTSATHETQSCPLLSRSILV